MPQPARTGPPRKPATVPRRVIFRDREIVVVHQPGASAYSLVTFSDLTFRPEGRSFWGEEVATKLGLDTVGVVARRENWFPRASMQAAAAAIRAVLKPQAVTYGYSMGAHGALKHAALLGAASTIAVTPQASIAPADVPWDERFHGFHRMPLHRDMRVSAADVAPFTAVIADPYHELDWRNARMAASATGTHLLRAPLSGHAAIWLLAATETLEAMLAAALAGDAAAMHAVLRQRRAQSGQWFRLMARAAFGRGHARLAENLWTRAGELGVSPAVLRYERAEALADRALRLIALGRVEDAAQACRTLAALSPQAAPRVGRAAHLLLSAGAAAEAEATFRRAIELRPAGADLHLGLSLSMAMQGRAADALAAAAQGHAAAPGDIDLGSHYGHLLNAAGPGRQADAEAIFRAVLAQDPRAGQALFGLSTVLAARGAVAEALVLAHRAAARLPGRPDVQEWHPRMLLRAGRAMQAERIFRRLAHADASRPAAHLGWADALVALDRRGEAIAALRRGLASLPGDPALAARLRELTAPATRLRAGIVDRLRGLFARAARRPEGRGQ
jgi:tetratricopeptide (TPR) repeat protein